MPSKNFPAKFDKALGSLENLHMDLQEYLNQKDIKPDNISRQKIAELHKKLEELFVYTHSLRRFMSLRNV